MLFIQSCFFVDINDIFVNFELTETRRPGYCSTRIGAYSPYFPIMLPSMKWADRSTEKFFPDDLRLPSLALSF